MRKVYYVPLFIILSFFCSNYVVAQTTAADTIGDLLKSLKTEKKASLKFGVNYLNNSVLLGRSDSIKTPLIEPEVKYTFKAGIFISANLDFIPNRSSNKLDAGSLAAGYDFDITDDLSGSVSYSKLFYNATSTQIGSSIGSTFNANLDYNIADLITPSVSIDYNLLKSGFGSDILINAGLAHDFAKEGLFGSDDLLIISPTATVNAGTQNFYDAFLTLKKYKLTKKGQAREAAAQKVLTAQDAKLSKFNLLDYELSVPTEYKMGHVIFSATPTYAFAENKLPPRITKALANTSGGLFYFQLGATLKF